MMRSSPRRRGPEAVLPEPPGRVEQIEVRLVDRELAADGHDEARAQQRDVERLAVVRRARPKRLELLPQMLDERRLRTEIAQQVLPEHELALFKMRQPDQEHVRARATRKPGGLGIEKKHVLPSGRRLALEAEMGEEQRVARSPSDDLQPKIVDCDPLLTHLEWGCALGGRVRRQPATSVCAQPARALTRGVQGGRRSQQRGAGCRDAPAGIRNGSSCAIALDDRGDLGPEVVHARERRCATDSRTSGPRAYAGPTQDGQPVPQPQAARCSRARSNSAPALLKRRSEKPMPPGVMSKR